MDGLQDSVKLMELFQKHPNVLGMPFINEGVQPIYDAARAALEQAGVKE